MRRDRSIGRLATVMARLIVMLAVIVGLTTMAAAQTAHRSKTRKAAPATEAQSGKLRQPTQAEARALSQELQRRYDRNPDNLNAVVTESGAVMIELPEEYHDVSIATLNPDGTMAIECVTGMKAATERIAGKRGRRAKPAHRHTPPSQAQQRPVWEEK